MKDLYTFDLSVPKALETYEQVRAAYNRIFEDLKLPVIIAKADSGNMGGKLSHEYHLPSSLGEDHVVSCSECDYVVNDEVAEAGTSKPVDSNTDIHVWRGISKDRSTLVNVWYPSSITGEAGGDPISFTDADVNVYAIKSLLPNLDGGIESPLSQWTAALSNQAPGDLRLVHVVDYRLPSSFVTDLKEQSQGVPIWPARLGQEPPSSIDTTILTHNDDAPLNVLRVKTGEKCPQCSSGTLRVDKAIELGHTFHLGTRYSEPLEATISIPSNKLAELEGSKAEAGSHEEVILPMQMGCHGIGVTRIIGAVANHLADEKGLNWPRKIAPYEVVVIPGRGLDDEALEVFDSVSSNSQTTQSPLDIVLDDRHSSFVWKLNDADLIGYPVLIVVGREWKASRRCEVQCRRLNVKEYVSLSDLPVFVNNLLDQL
jgi:prolyl-tRNA synthetase